MNKINKRVIEDLIDYKFKSSSLLLQAFYDKDLDEEDDNLSLALVGESLLDATIMSILAHIYSDEENIYSFTKANEELVELKQGILSKKYLSSRASILNLKEYYNDGNKLYSDKMLKDAGVVVIKALVGAVAIDSGYSFKAIVRVVGRLCDPVNYLISYSGINYQRKLICFAKDYEGECEYEDIEDGNRYYCTVYLPNPDIEYVATTKISFQGFGFNEEQARDDAARAAYEFLTREDYFIPTIFDNDTDLVYSYSKHASVSKALEIVGKLVNDKLLSKPIIKTEYINKRYYVRVRVDEYKEEFLGDSSKPDTARRRALYSMLKKINEDIESLE